MIFKILLNARGKEKQMLPLVGWHATIRHFLISHDTPCSPPPPAPTKNLKKMALISPVPREGEDNAYAIFLGKQGVLWKMCKWRIAVWKEWFFLCWLYKGFQGQHLPRLSINFVVINKDLEKLQTQLYYIKVWFCDDQVYNDIRVVLSTKWRHNLFYLQLYFMALETVLPKSLTEAFFSFLSNIRFDFREVEARSMRALSRYLGMKFLWLEIR